MHFLLLVGNHNLVVFIQVIITPLSQLFLVQSGLYAIQVFVQLRFIYTKLILFCFFRHAQFSITCGTMLQTSPEVRILSNDCCIVVNGFFQVSCGFKQQSTVEKRHVVIGFNSQHKIKVFYSSVVISHLCSQQASVIVSQIVIGVYIQRCVIVCHGTTQIVLLQPCQGSVDIITWLLGFQMNRLVQCLFCWLPLLFAQVYVAFGCPYRPIILINLYAFVQCFQGLYCIFLQQQHLGPHAIGRSIVRPSVGYCIKLCYGLAIVLTLNMAQHSVVPQVLVVWGIGDGSAVIIGSPSEIVSLDASNGSQFVIVDNIGITLYGFGTISLCAKKIFQIVLCQSTEEPWLIEIRFGTYRLIEILDRKHIILVIERAAPYHQ